MSEKFKILEVDPKIRLFYTVPVDSKYIDDAVQFVGFFRETFLLGTKEDFKWSLDQITFVPTPEYMIEDRKQRVEFILSADLVRHVNVIRGTYLSVPSEYALGCEWETRRLNDNRKVLVRAKSNKFTLQFTILLKSAFQTVQRIREMLDECSIIIPRLTSGALDCLSFISGALNPRHMIWDEMQDIRSLKRFLFLFDAFQNEFELLMTISPTQVCQMREFITEWFDIFKLIKPKSSRTTGCVTVENRVQTIAISIAGLKAHSISTNLQNPLPTDSVYINEVFRFLLMAIACIKLSEKDGTFISRITREVFERN